MIREVTREDIPRCVQVITESFMTVADEFGFTQENAPRFTAFATTEQRLLWQLENEPRKMYVYCAEDGRAAGYYSLLFTGDGACELNNLCVLPHSRHKSIGRQLLEDAFARAREAGCRRMDIGIVEENALLRSWYESHGFIHTGTKKFDFFPFTCGYMEKPL